jgi:hypothetical protein
LTDTYDDTFEDDLGEGPDEEIDVISFHSEDEIERSIVEAPFRAIYQINNFLLPQLKDIIDEDRTLNLRPEYQRRSRWTPKQKSLLIESLLLNIPIPPIFLFESELARYEVMDGQQRLLAVREFLSNEFRLSSLSVLSPLNGRNYKQLPPRTKKTLDRASLSAIVLLKESRASLRDAASKRVLELRKFVFERLNTGGKRLNPQEIRNAIYAGRFNDAIIDLTREKVFTDIWHIPPYPKKVTEEDYESPQRKRNALYKTMGDCQIALRFFALRDRDAIRGSMRSMLDRCMEHHLQDSDEVCETLKSEFRSRLKLAHDLFDGRPFLLSKSKDARPSVSMYDAVMIALDRNWRKRNALLTAKGEVQRLYWAALKDDEGVEKFTGRANTSQDIRARIAAMETLFKSALR